MARMTSRLLGREESPCAHAGGAKFCPACGQQLIVARYGWGDLFGAAPDIWMQKGFRRTVIGLFLHPGHNIRAFLFSDRNHLIKPLAYLALALAFGLWAEHLTDGALTCAPQDRFCEFLDRSPMVFEFAQIVMLVGAYYIAFRRSLTYSVCEFFTGVLYIVAQASVLTGLVFLALFAVDQEMRVGIAFLLRNLYIITAIIRFLGITGPWPRTGAALLGVIVIVLFLLGLVVAMLLSAGGISG